MSQKSKTTTGSKTHPSKAATTSTGMANNNIGTTKMTFEEAKKLLYANRGDVGDEACWWGLELALNNYRDAPNQQARRTALVAVRADAEDVKESQKEKQRADKNESKRVGWIVGVTLIVIAVVVVWFGMDMDSLTLNPGTTNVSSLLKALVFDVSVCTAVLSGAVIVLNGLKLFNSSEKGKKFVDVALCLVGCAALLFSVIALLFNFRM